MSNYLISNATGVLSANISAKTDSISNILVEPSSAIVTNEVLASAALPSAGKASQVTTFTSFGITTTIELSSRKSIRTGIEVTTENRNWTIHSTEQCQALDAAFNKIFAEQYPDMRNPFSSIDVAILQTQIGKLKETVILFSDNGQVKGDLRYDKEETLANEYRLTHDSDFNSSAMLMVYKQLVLERGFIGRNGKPLAHSDIGGKNDANGYGNNAVRGDLNGIGKSRTFAIFYGNVFRTTCKANAVNDFLSGTLVPLDK